MAPQSPTLDLRRFSSEFGIPYLEKISPVESILPFEFLREHEIVPVEENQEAIFIAIHDPAKLDLLDALRTAVKKQVRPVLASPALIREALVALERKRAGSSENVMAELAEHHFGAEISGEAVQDVSASAEMGPVVKLVNRLIWDALERRATDIHIQPGEKNLTVRLRVDGMLHEWGAPTAEALGAIVSRIKVMSGLNIAEKRLPQDGRTTIKLGEREVDVRVSVVPTSAGERVVLRLLDKGNLKLDLEDLGFSEETGSRFRRLIQAPHGIVLVTGPTGSGKTTTLYAALSALKKHSSNIMTVEDPVEYRLDGISQMQVKPEIGLTFAAGLRSLLRQDPDVLMVGEIRDVETAQVAVQAALTGHLVLATLHTNDAPSALTRLTEIGVEPYLISSTVRGVLAQRLVRIVCRECRGAGKGCAACMESGFRGRVGIYELLLPDEKLHRLIQGKADDAQMRAAAAQAGMIPLAEDGMKKVAVGLTTPEEVWRVTN